VRQDAGGRGSLACPLAEAPYGWRADPSVPAFPDDKALIVFDGDCVLCSACAGFIRKRDGARAFRFATAQSPLGQALYRHYGLDRQKFATNLLLVGGRADGKRDTLVLTGLLIGGRRRLLRLLRLPPRGLADGAYDAVAANRHRLFGRRARCMMPPPEWRERFLG
jgi:predicted DCC family thiol-disulfide oxidoreductase YuxK